MTTLPGSMNIPVENDNILSTQKLNRYYVKHPFFMNSFRALAKNNSVVFSVLAFVSVKNQMLLTVM